MAVVVVMKEMHSNVCWGGVVFSGRLGDGTPTLARADLDTLPAWAHRRGTSQREAAMTAGHARTHARSDCSIVSVEWLEDGAKLSM
jgi:hypothetical protein